MSTAYANIVTFNYLVAVNWQALGEVGGARRGYTEEGAECDKLPANWCVPLRAVPGLTRQQTEIPPVQVLLGETENAGSKNEKDKKGELRENQEADRFEIAE